MTSSEGLYCNTGYGEALPPSAHFAITPDALSAAVSHLVRDWGEYGYTIRGITNVALGAVWLVHYGCSDGSRFGALVDKWGNISDISETATEADVLAMARELVSA